MTIAFDTGAPRRRMPGSLFGLAVALGASFLAGGIGSAFTFPSLTSWYAGLDKPSFNPPNGVFGPVWTALYILMAVAVWLVWKRARETAQPSGGVLALFGLQLVLNAGWSIAFFGGHNPAVGLVVIAALWLAIVGCIVAFWRLSRAGALLMLPYLAWVSFATALNVAIWQLN